MNHETPVKDREAFLQLLGELNAGTFLDNVVASFKTASLATSVHGDKGKKGKLTLVFDMARIGETMQLQVGHTVELVAPTARGKRSEIGSSSTPVYVGRTGTCSILPPPDQGALFNPDAVRDSSNHQGT